jgi:hypothetical protein
MYSTLSGSRKFSDSSDEKLIRDWARSETEASELQKDLGRLVRYELSLLFGSSKLES